MKGDAWTAALEEERFDEAFELLVRAASEGDTEAEFRLGTLWEEGVCTCMEDAEEYERLSRAEDHYKRAAERGHGGAALALARLYASPYWLHDFDASLAWYERAAQAGEGEAQDYLRARADALKTVEEADGGDLAAMLKASELLFAGKYLQKNERAAMRFLRGAAEKDYPPAVEALADRLYRDRAYGEAAAWIERALALGYDRRLCPLARMYAEGEGVGKDAAHAEQLYRLALGKGDAEALAGLGYLYAGDPALYDPAAALRCFCEYEEKTGKHVGKADEIREIAALSERAEHDPEAAFRLAEAFRYGRGVPRDLRSAREHYERAARLGHAEGMERTADFCYYGEDGCERDLKKAAYWYERAAECGRRSAQKQIALMYHGGEGTERDLEKALAWIGKLKGDSYFGGDAERLMRAWESEPGK